MTNLFDTILYAPFFNFLVFLYNTAAFNDFGVAIILLTLIIRLILSPLSIKALGSQKALTRLQPQIKEIQAKFKDDREKQTREIMEIYRQNKVNPFSGCLPLLVQLPILIALYRVSIAGFESNSFSVLYDFVRRPEFLNPTSLGFIDLTQKSLLLSLIAGTTQFLQTKLGSFHQKDQASQKNQKGGQLEAMNRQMLYFFPIITIIISMSFPAGLPLYWIATTAFSILEQVYVNRLKINVNGRPSGKFNPPNS